MPGTGEGSNGWEHKQTKNPYGLERRDRAIVRFYIIGMTEKKTH